MGKDLRWLGAGIAATTVLVVGVTINLSPTTLLGNSLPSVVIVCARLVGGCFAAVAALGLIVANNPRYLYLYSLSRTLSKCRSGKWNHWDEIIPDKLVLGAIPGHEHLDLLVKSEDSDDAVGITSVLALVQDYEFTHSIIFKPIQISDWKKRDVNTLWIPTGDYLPVSTQDLINGADFIHQEIENNGKVYVHCKAGKGRSTACCIAYCIKYRGMSFEDSFQYIKSIRPQVHLNSSQRNAAKEIESIVKNQNAENMK